VCQKKRANFSKAQVLQARTNDDYFWHPASAHFQKWCAYPLSLSLHFYLFYLLLNFTKPLFESKQAVRVATQCAPARCTPDAAAQLQPIP